jgi:hypothetical protein
MLKNNLLGSIFGIIKIRDSKYNPAQNKYSKGNILLIIEIAKLFVILYNIFYQN